MYAVCVLEVHDLLFDFDFTGVITGRKTALSLAYKLVEAREWTVVV